MSSARVLFAILKADFLERTRRTSFLVTICLVIYLGYAVNTGQIFIKLGDARGIYNSAWVGSLMALVITFFLGIFGFYLVKNTVERDERTGVGQILATTPLTRAQYLLGKWLSNFTVLTALVAILALAAVFMQLIQHEDTQIQLWALIAPFLFIALPMMALVAAFAVFFESVSWLKGGFGNLVYFFVFMAITTAGIFLTATPWLDVVGLSLIGGSMKAATKAAFPDYGGGFVLGMAADPALKTFVWTGLVWTPGLILQRLAWLVVAMGLALSGSLFFRRFDPSRRLRTRSKSTPGAESDLVIHEPANPVTQSPATLTPLSERGRFRSNFWGLAWLESLLLVKGLKWYWLAGMAVLWIGSLAAPSEATRKFWFMLAVIWPVLVWSKMGQREARFQTEQLIYTAAHPLLRLMGSGWLAGVIVTAIAASGVLLGRLVHSQPLNLLTWSLAVIFIPSLALALGVWSRSSKLFEVIYPILWYLGPFNSDNGLAAIDYLGIHAGAPVNSAPLWMAVVILALVLLAIVGKSRQMRI